MWVNISIMQNQKYTYKLKVRISWDARSLEGSVIPLGEPQMSLTHHGWIIIYHFKQTQGTVLLCFRYLLQQAQYCLWSLIYTNQKIITGHAMCTVHTTDLLNLLCGAGNYGKIHSACMQTTRNSVCKMNKYM